MANRVTTAEVNDIMPDMDSSTDVDAFITAANLFVTANVTCAAATAAILKEIERWYAAHLIAVGYKEARLSQEKIGDGEDRFQGKTDMGIRSTLYGQQAIDLDPCGALKRIADGKRTASMVTLDPQP